MVFALALCSFSDNFQSTRNVFQWSIFFLWKDTSVTLAVRRPKQFALYTIPNKLSSREVLSTKNIPQGNAVLRTGNSSFHEDWTILADQPMVRNLHFKLSL